MDSYGMTSYGDAGSLIAGPAILSSSAAVMVELAIVVLLVVGCWKMFERAGEAGWKSLVPVYNSYVLYKISWATRPFFYSLGCVAAMVVSMVAVVVSAMSAAFGGGSGAAPILWGAVCFAASVGELVLTVMRDIRLAKAFGKDAGWAVGLVLVPCVFYVLLGVMPDVSYIGPEGRPKASGHVNYSELG